MNKIIKILKKVTVILAIGVMNILCLENSIYAADLTSANVYMVEDCGQLLTYKGVPVITSYIEYNCNGEKYPAYCLDKTKHSR